MICEIDINVQKKDSMKIEFQYNYQVYSLTLSIATWEYHQVMNTSAIRAILENVFDKLGFDQPISDRSRGYDEMKRSTRHIKEYVYTSNSVNFYRWLKHEECLALNIEQYLNQECNDKRRKEMNERILTNAFQTTCFDEHSKLQLLTVQLAKRATELKRTEKISKRKTN